MRQNPMSEQEIKRMRDMLAAGYGSEAIAKELKRHRSTITHRLQFLRNKKNPEKKKDGLTPPRTIVNAAIREPLSGSNWMPARPGAMDYARVPSRGIA